MTRNPTESSEPAASDRWASFAAPSEDLGSRLATAASAAPPLRGGGGGPSPGVIQGESVFALMTDAAYFDLCCSPVGKSGQVYCLNTSSDCTIASHVANRENGNIRSFPAGIHVRAAGGNYNAYCEPVGEISLLDHHREAILSHVCRDATKWPSLFNDWSTFTSSEDAAASRESVTKAKLVQTPAKRSSVVLNLAKDIGSLNLGAPSVALPISEDAGLGLYEEVWNSSAAAVNKALPASFTVKKFLTDLWQQSSDIKDSTTAFGLNLDEDRKWADSEIESSNRRITDLELALGSPRSNWNYGPTIWESMGAVATVVESGPSAEDVNQSWAGVSKLTAEFDSMFKAVTSFRTRIGNDLSHLSNKLGALEAGSVGGNPGSVNPARFDALVSQMDDMVARIEDLEINRLRDKATIDSLQTRLEVGSQRFELRSGAVLRSARDLRAAIIAESAAGIDFGGFADVYNVWLRAINKSAGNPSMLDALKTMKDVKSVGLSEDEAFVVHSFAGTLPGSISGTKTEKSSIPSLQNQSKWRNPSNTIGMACDLENNLPLVKSDISIIIQENYRAYPDLASLAKDMQLHAIDFIQDFIRWVDDITKSLVSSGNQPADVWVLVTTVMRAIFEEGIAPNRITPTKTSFDKDNSHRASVMIWGAVRTYLATEAIQKKGFKDHPVVVGAYAKWLVNHSGKKDASEAKSAVQKLQSELGELKNSTATKKSVSSLEARVETVKGVADKAKQQCSDLKSRLSSS